jgi:glycosyltransferase involved in cell wall biosynthesis
MTKLLMVTTVPVVLTNFLLPFATHFRDRGWQVDAMSCGFLDTDGCDRYFDRLWEVQWSRNPLDPRNLLGTPEKIREIVARERYDIIHVHTPVAAFVTRYALKDLRHQIGASVIYTAHGFHFLPGANPLKNWVFLALEKLAGNWTDYLVTIVREDAAAIDRHRLVSPAAAFYMPGIGVDLDYYNRHQVPDAAVELFRAELGINAQTPLLLSVAEFTRRKRHQDTIAAFAKLNRSEVHLAIAGDGPLLAQMKQLAIDLGVADRLHFLGRRNDIPVLMKAATANILVSDQEGLPRSVLESLALELPTIGTKIRGTQDLLAGGAGLLVDVGDISGLTAAITWILDRPEDSSKMAQCGRQGLLSTYDLQHIIQLHTELYDRALASSGAHSGSRLPK